MRSTKRKNNLLILLLLILFIGVGYAMLTTTLNINGTGKVKNAKWDVHFANIQVTGGSVTPTTAANITADTSAEFAVTLEKPGDFYEFTIDVVNAGTIDAMIDSFSKTPETVPDCVNYTVTWANGETPKAKDCLAKGKTYQMRVRVEMLKDITTDQLLTAEETLTLSVQLDCVQATSEAQYTVPAAEIPEEIYVPKYFGFWVPTESSTQDYRTLTYPHSNTHPEAEGKPAKVFVALGEDLSQYSMCAVKDGSVECFRNGEDYVDIEQEHLRNLFGESNCVSSSVRITCGDDAVACDIDMYGNVECVDRVTWFGCSVSSGNGFSCG